MLYDIQNHFQSGSRLHRVLMRYDQLDYDWSDHVAFTAYDQIPDCWLINSYSTADKFIDWHSDDGHLFGALDGPAEILAISLGADGVFNVSSNAESSS